jgi:DNA-directed RNA polymerase specialized sigma24 family protein
MSGVAESRAQSAQERFARERWRYERAIIVRMRGALTREDAEDVVSEAIIESAAQCPDDAASEGRLWFMRVVLNRAEDFRRSRYGRPRSARGPAPDRPVATGALWSFVSWDDVTARGLEDLPNCSVQGPAELLEAVAERRDASFLVAAGLDAVTPCQQRLLRLRYLHPVRLTRQEIADRLELSLTQYETRHTTAWRAFASAVRAHAEAPRPALRLVHGGGESIDHRADDEQLAAAA